jgi:hypothetical protein
MEEANNAECNSKCCKVCHAVAKRAVMRRSCILIIGNHPKIADHNVGNKPSPKHLICIAFDGWFFIHLGSRACPKLQIKDAVVRLHHVAVMLLLTFTLDDCKVLHLSNEASCHVVSDLQIFHASPRGNRL